MRPSIGNRDFRAEGSVLLSIVGRALALVAKARRSVNWGRSDLSLSLHPLLLSLVTVIAEDFTALPFSVLPPILFFRSPSSMLTILFRFNVKHRWPGERTVEDHKRTTNAARSLKGQQPWFCVRTTYGPYYVCFSPNSINVNLRSSNVLPLQHQVDRSWSIRS